MALRCYSVPAKREQESIGYGNRLSGAATAGRVFGGGVFPEVETTTPVDAAIWLLEHLHRIETMQPPLLWTLHTCQALTQHSCHQPQSHLAWL